ncbi:hypothetical protein PSENEW3n2_00005371 [Picochlorum sp. SENEW3]|nr:hypothetical protein PSENEW3n2_00005371 [Picochlorum sp. SENEW3]WPT17366.1 hypothetical protein PSENEW3_00005371 [Picochlorum sp. SENEW3]
MTLIEQGIFALFVGALFVKPHELPRLARQAGRIAGRAATKLQRIRREISEYVDKNEMNSVHEELQDTVAQLDKIRRDVRSMSSLKGMILPENVGSSSRARVPPPPSVQKDVEGSKQEDTPSYTMIPVSAEDVRAASRDHGHHRLPETASETLMDALQEERVAHEAKKFFNSSETKQS